MQEMKASSNAYKNITILPIYIECNLLVIQKCINFLFFMFCNSFCIFSLLNRFLLTLIVEENEFSKRSFFMFRKKKNVFKNNPAGPRPVGGRLSAYPPPGRGGGPPPPPPTPLCEKNFISPYFENSRGRGM